MKNAKLNIRYLEILYVIFIIFNFCFAYYFYTNTNGVIPIHWSLNSNPDQWGSKYLIFVGPIIGLVIYLLFSILINRFIKKNKSNSEIKENYEDNINDKNHLNYAAMYLNLSKYIFILIPFSVLYSSYSLSIGKPMQLLIIARFLFILVSVFFIFKASQHISSIQLNRSVSIREIFKKDVFYNNKNDKNIIVPRSYGGYTINFGTTQGKIIFLLLMIVPILIVLMLLLYKK